MRKRQRGEKVGFPSGFGHRGAWQVRQFRRPCVGRCVVRQQLYYPIHLITAEW